MFSSPPLKVVEAPKARYPEFKQSWRVFLSFSGDIRNEVEKIYDALLRLGIKQEDIFFDKYSIPPGGNFQKICKYGVANSDLFVGVIDKTYITKNDPQMEAVYGLGKKALRAMKTFYYVRKEEDVAAIQKKMKEKLQKINSDLCVSDVVRTRTVSNETVWAPAVAKEIKEWLDNNPNHRANQPGMVFEEIEGQDIDVQTFWPKWMTSQHYRGIAQRPVHFIDTSNLPARQQKFPSFTDTNSPVKVIVLSSTSTFDKEYGEAITGWKKLDHLILFPLFLDHPNNVTDGEFVSQHLGTIMRSDEDQAAFFHRARENLCRTELPRQELPNGGLVDKKRKLDDAEQQGLAKKIRTDGGSQPLFSSPFQ